jgi:protoporphyrinogen oxidase
MTVGIVGGGIAGLGAAHRLQARGHDVRVFEASDDIGGLAAVHQTSGDPIEKFYHHLSKTEETIVELAEDLGVGDRVQWIYGNDGYYVDGVVHPLNTIWEIAAYPHMSLYDKFRLGMLTMEVDVRGGVPSFDTYDDLETYEDVPIKDFLVEHTTRGVYENFFEPLLDAKFGDRKDEVSAAWLLGRIKFRGERDLLKGEQLGYFDGSFAVLIDALIDSVGRENVQTGARVVALDETDASATDESDGHVTSLTVETPEGRETHDVDSVVVAAMPNVLEDLTGYACDVDFQGAVCAVVTMDRSLMDETYWLNVAHDAPFGALIEHTNFVPPERYGGDHLLYVASYVQSPDEWLWQADDDAVRDRWLDHIDEMFPEQFDAAMVEDVRISRNPRAAPVYERGYLEMVVPYDVGAAADAVPDGVYYAGMASRAQYPERSLNGGIVAGYECADRIDDAPVRTPDAIEVESS